MRWIICGEFVVVSPLALHTGNQEDFSHAAAPVDEINDLVPVGKENPAEISPVQGIELDERGFPVLPGTAIKGLLRGLASEISEVEISERIGVLFGEIPVSIGEGKRESPVGGMIEFRSARLSDSATIPTHRPAIRGKTELFEGTRTADDGQLRHDRIIAPDTRFRAKFVLTRAERADVELLLGLLALVDGTSSRSAIGSSTSQGDGRVRWDGQHVSCLGQDQAKKWLEAPTSNTWESHAKVVEVDPIRVTVDDGLFLDIPLKIDLVGHFLVSAWGSYLAESKDGKTEAKAIRRPFRVSTLDRRTARLPGASLDGALRAQARRIFRTMSGDAAPWDRDDINLPDAFGSLFGSAEHASLLEVETFLDTGTKEAVRQEFVALDRLSGGVSGEKKFAIEAFEEPELTGQLRLRLSRRVDPALTGKRGVSSELTLKPSAVGLLALLLKDLATGDIPLGYATRKGYGGVGRLTSQGADWKDLLRAVGEGIVANAAKVKDFDVFLGMTAENALRHAIELLQDEARTWAASRSLEPVGGTE
jgi:CRISPR/Cas system CSM-associated protein Csm3 (group 7 of RAMP superfamily)